MGIKRKFLEICDEGDVDAARRLLEKHGTAFYACDGLVRACVNGHIDIVKLIFEYGTCFDFTEAFFGACQNGRLEIVQYMIEQGVCEWNTGLCGACDGGCMEMVKFMIEKGANNWDGGLFHACESGHLEIVKLMLEKGSENLNTWCLAMAYQSGNMDLVNYIVQQGVNEWKSCMHIARAKNSLKMMQFIIENGGSTETCDYPEIVSLLNMGLNIGYFSKNSLFQSVITTQDVRKKKLESHMSSILPMDIIRYCLFTYINYET